MTLNPELWCWSSNLPFAGGIWAFGFFAFHNISLTETTIVYWGFHMGIVENQMETLIVYWGHNNGKSGGNYYSKDRLYPAELNSTGPWFDSNLQGQV